ncbi:MAG: thiamine ABC transporter substrate-binding protein [Acidimicrobiia bacterium]|nr:thiamine ABC transporter substrate-binding protein [Acidimicrobiia bacterium]
MRRLLVIGALIASACGGNSADKVTLLTHDSFAVSDDVLATFTQETGISVEVLRAGDGGAMLNRAILTKDNPLADVIFGIDNSLLARALDQGILDTYEPVLLRDVPDELEAGTEGRAIPIDFGDVCINYDVGHLGEIGQARPESMDELLAPEFEGLLVVEDPSISSPGLAFLLATIDEYGEQGWQDYWRALVANDVRVSAGWEEAYYSAFSYHGGDRPLVVSYASSPPAEVIFAEEPLVTAPTGVLTDSCYRQVEYAAVLKGTNATEAARQFIDFMLGVEFQQDIPLNMFVFPANEQAAIPADFVKHTTLPSEPRLLDPDFVGANRDAWIAEWASIVLR